MPTDPTELVQRSMFTFGLFLGAGRELTKTEMATLLGVNSRNTIYNWTIHGMPGPIEMLLRMMLITPVKLWPQDRVEACRAEIKERNS